MIDNAPSLFNGMQHSMSVVAERAL